MTSPLVSVIIPTYNRLANVQTAIDSVFQQTYANYEIIVVDDGSTDGTQDVIPEKYQGKVNYYWQENHGRSAARNFGASLAKGAYLAFLDSDDVWAPSKLQMQITKFLTCEMPDIAAVCSSVYFIDKLGRLIYPKPLGRHKELHLYSLDRFLGSPIILAPPSNMLIKKEFFNRAGGFDERMSYGEDWDLIIRLRQHGRFLYIDDPLTYYRFGAKFLNDLPELEQIPSITSDLLRLYQKINAIGNRNPSLSDKSTLSVVHEKAAYWYFARKAYAMGMEHLLRSGKLQHTDLDTVMTNLGYWGAYSAVEYKGADPILCELDFKVEFAPSIMALMKSEIALSKGDYRRLFSSFYHNLAWHLFPGVNGNPIRWLCLKAIVNNPLYLCSVQTMKLLLVSTCYDAHERILKTVGNPTKAGID